MLTAPTTPPLAVQLFLYMTRCGFSAKDPFKWEKVRVPRDHWLCCWLKCTEM